MQLYELPMPGWLSLPQVAILLGMSSAQNPDPAKKPKRTVYAPQTDVGPGVAISVDLSDDEEVQWQWSYGPGGQSHITGYQISKKLVAK